MIPEAVEIQDESLEELIDIFFELITEKLHQKENDNHNIHINQ